MDINRTKDIIEGFEDDFNEIVKDFTETFPNLRLVEFFKYWTNNSLDCLFVNRFDPRELFEAISAINQLLVQIVTDSFIVDKSKLIALYFILCLYVKQPNRLRRKIRLTCDDVLLVQNLTNELASCSSNSDVNFVWKQLRILQAIDFVEDRVLYGPSMLVNRGANKTAESDITHLDLIIEKKKDTIEFLEGKIEPALLGIERICAPYEQIIDTLKLNDYKDSTIEVERNGTIREFVDQAKTLLIEFKAKSS